MSRDIIHTDNAPAAVGTYSQAVKVDKTVYISGQIGLDPNTMTLADGFVAQANQVMSNIDAICQAAGGSLANVVKFNVSLTDLADFTALNKIFAARLSAPILPVPRCKWPPCQKVRWSKLKRFWF